MMKEPLVDQYSKEELEQIVSQSNCLNEVIDKIGYSTHSGDNHKTVRNRLEKYQIDTSHFRVTTGLVLRSDEEVFTEDSKVSQHCLRNRVLNNQTFPYVCSICGQLPEWNGKQLPLILDHINGKNHDNRIENLRWVCPNCNQQLPTTGSRNIYYNQKHLKKKYYCKCCGKEISSSSKSGYCKSCAKRKFYGTPDINRDELKQLIRSTSFLDIGKRYGISDNAIRKWCKKYGLPHKKEDIHLIPDEQWNMI